MIKKINIRKEKALRPRRNSQERINKAVDLIRQPVGALLEVSWTLTIKMTSWLRPQRSQWLLPPQELIHNKT